MVTIPASITIERPIAVRKYKWRNSNRVSIYRRKSRRAVLRITSSYFVKSLLSLDKIDKQVTIDFHKNKGIWTLIVNRAKGKGSTIQAYPGEHSYLQIVVNRQLPLSLWEEHENSHKKTYTKHVNIELNLNQWWDIQLEPHHFLPEVEKYPKMLIKASLNQGFNVNFVPKGRSYDLELIGPKGNKFIIAVSSHIAKNKSRSKEKRKQKILMDIAKILPVLESSGVLPVIVSEPLEFKGSWSFTTDAYLDFYRQKFNFNFITTEFKKGWEREVCNKLLELDKNAKL